VARGGAGSARRRERVCGDGVCNGDKTPATCPADCAWCGDGACNGNETSFTCPGDCAPTCRFDVCPIESV
jgi:hypothetical protein